MALFLSSQLCNVAIVLYHGNNILTRHDRNKQSLTLPFIQVKKVHLMDALTGNDEDNPIIDPIIDAFRRAGTEYVSSLKLQIRDVKHIKNGDSSYLFKCDIYNTRTEIFAIEVLSEEINDISIVSINVDKIFCKLGTANNNEVNVYYNGLKIETLSAIVLIEYWNLHF